MGNLKKWNVKLRMIQQWQNQQEVLATEDRHCQRAETTRTSLGMNSEPREDQQEQNDPPKTATKQPSTVSVD
jgi:hypothetical protein